MRIFVLLFSSILLCFGFVQKKTKYNYLAIGDGYTKGIGVNEEQRWPNLVSAHFKEKKFKFKQVATLADTNYTVNDVIKKHMTEIQLAEANMVSIMLGAEEVKQNMPIEEFAAVYEKFLQLVLDQVPSHNSVILITIPDFTSLPLGNQMTSGFDARAKIIEFNKVIMYLGKEYNMHVFDIFRESNQLGKVDNLLAANGIYPSEKGHKVWAQLLIPEFDYMMRISLDKELKKKYITK